jgi:excisionase family DNA binding protein
MTTKPADLDADDQPSPWLTPREAAARARVATTKVIYAAIHAGKLRAVRLSARKNVRIHVDWVDAWMRSATLINPDAPGDDVPLPSPFDARRARR